MIEDEELEASFYRNVIELNNPKSLQKIRVAPSSSSIIGSEFLTPKEFEAKLREGITVSSSIIKGRTYFLQMGKRIKVLDKGKNDNDTKVSYLCVGTNDAINLIDEHMALYLNLLLNEKQLLRTANIMNTDSHRLLVEIGR